MRLNKGDSSELTLLKVDTMFLARIVMLIFFIFPQTSFSRGDYSREEGSFVLEEAEVPWQNPRPSSQVFQLLATTFR